jgi:very-short-patch-repair endonuclease
MHVEGRFKNAVSDDANRKRSESLKKAYAEGRHSRSTSDDVRRSWESRSRVVSDESRKKRSESLKKAYVDGRHARPKINNLWALKKYYSENERVMSEETKKKISESHKGRKFTDEHRRNLSISHKGQIPVFNGYMLKGYRHSDISKKNMSDGQKRAWKKKSRMNDLIRLNMSRSHSDDFNIALARSKLIEVMKRRESVPEKKIRLQLESDGIVFERQFVVNGGEFIFDFRIENLLIECDSMYWHMSPKMVSQDHKKTQWAKNNGFELFRVDEKDVLRNDFSITEVIFNG